MFAIQMQFISGCMVGVEILDRSNEERNATGLVIDLFILRLMFLYVDRD
jgi:hypothetical protein